MPAAEVLVWRTEFEFIFDAVPPLVDLLVTASRRGDWLSVGQVGCTMGQGNLHGDKHNQ